jgi:hypothetical protein
MIGTLISARMMPPLSRFTPTGAPVVRMMIGPSTM